MTYYKFGQGSLLTVKWVSYRVQQSVGVGPMCPSVCLSEQSLSNEMTSAAET